MRLLLLSLLLSVLVIPARSASNSVESQLRQDNRGKTFLLRGFPSGEWLVYNSSGEPLNNETTGDWTVDGFIVVDELHISVDRLFLDGHRLLVIATDKGFHLRPAGQQSSAKEAEKPILVRIEITLGTSNPSIEQAKAPLSQIFFTGTDSLVRSVPVYWRTCLTNGLLRKDPVCQFSQEFFEVPGLSLSEFGAPPSASAVAEAPDDLADIATEHPMREGDGVTPPKALFAPEPEFSNAARISGYQGVVTLGVIVDREGIPRYVRVLKPRGAGLDAQAVESVKTWRFEPASRDGHPISFEIAIQIDFHLSL